MTDEITARHVAALGAFINALRALPEEFQSGCVHDTREHVKTAIKASLDDIPALAAEVRALRAENANAGRVTLWRCSECGRWSHAKRRPRRHTRFVSTEDIPDGVPAERVRTEREVDTGAWFALGYDADCGPFVEYRAERVA